jgi:hypothetical protein
LLDFGGRYPVDRLAIRLPQPNSVAPVQILARNDPNEPWQPVAQTVAYRLHQNDKEIVSPEVSVPATPWRYWLLRIEHNAAAVGAGSLRVTAGWVTREIVFAARGNGPFLVAFGNARAQSNALTIDALVPGWGTERAPSIASASTGGLRTLAGAGAAQARIDPKKAGLWAALVAGVVLLGWMAWGLSKQLRSGAVE